MVNGLVRSISRATRKMKEYRGHFTNRKERELGEIESTLQAKKRNWKKK